MIVNKLCFKCIVFFQKLNISGIEFTPEDLLSLGNQMKEGSNQSLSWAEYYKLIVEVVDSTVADYLMQVVLLTNNTKLLISVFLHIIMTCGPILGRSLWGLDVPDSNLT